MCVKNFTIFFFLLFGVFFLIIEDFLFCLDGFLFVCCFFFFYLFVFFVSWMIKYNIGLFNLFFFFFFLFFLYIFKFDFFFPKSSVKKKFIVCHNPSDVRLTLITPT